MFESVFFIVYLYSSELYDTCVLPLKPDTVMIHIGENRKYWKNISDFEQKYSFAVLS